MHLPTQCPSVQRYVAGQCAGKRHGGAGENVDSCIGDVTASGSHVGPSNLVDIYKVTGWIPPIGIGYGQSRLAE